MEMCARPRFRIVDDADRADPDAICVSLFREGSRLMAWYIGPVEASAGGILVRYLPKSMREGAATAIVAAMGKAVVDHRDICIIDPEDLWAAV